MKYYFLDIETPNGVIRNILFPINEQQITVFLDVETNTGPERQAYLAWVAEGNTATEWQPE